MSPSKETIEEFKRIYQEEFGEKISDSQAYEKFLRLVNLIRAILKGLEYAASAHKDQSNKAPGPLLIDENHGNDNLKE